MALSTSLLKNLLAVDWVVMPACLTTHECRNVLEALSDGGGNTQPGRCRARHLMVNPVVVALRNTDLLIRLASERLKFMAIPLRATLFEKSRTTNWLVPWHQDTALVCRFEHEDWGAWSVRQAPHMLTLRLGRFRELWP
jgi:hypothetical protein